jgi:hypothetical protein
MTLEILRLNESNDKTKDSNMLKNVISRADNKLCGNHIQNIFTNKKDYLCYSILVSGVHHYMHTQTECLRKNVRYVKIRELGFSQYPTTEYIDLIMT